MDHVAMKVGGSFHFEVRVVLLLFGSWLLCVFYTLKPERPELGPCAIHSDLHR